MQSADGTDDERDSRNLASGLGILLACVGRIGCRVLPEAEDHHHRRDQPKTRTDRLQAGRWRAAHCARDADENQGDENNYVDKDAVEVEGETGANFADVFLRCVLEQDASKRVGDWCAAFRAESGGREAGEGIAALVAGSASGEIHIYGNVWRRKVRRLKLSHRAGMILESCVVCKQRRKLGASSEMTGGCTWHVGWKKGIEAHGIEASSGGAYR